MKKVVVKRKGNEIVSVSATVEPIDYDKLAEAIVAAQEKQTSQYSVTREWMKILVVPVFWGIAIVTGLLGIVFIWQGGKTFVESFQNSAEKWLLDACVGGTGFIIGLFFIAIAILTGASAKEIDKEKDKNFVVSVFSGIVSLVALVVSLIALIQGVG
ncbi:MAG: hypothetical protein IJO04_01910 [Oscillospiraceae bacterium]|nr:hypothetical protein [Oscillospiraceae bacterium]